MEVLNNYFVGIESIENINDDLYKPSIIHEYLSETTSGYGKLIVSNENESYTYNGQLINGKMEGNGYIKFNNDKRFPEYESYNGELLNNKFNGSGKICYLNGDTFIGTFNNGQKNGNGKMYNLNGDLIMDNIWKNDVICGKVNYIEYYHNSKIPKITGILFNSNKIGTWKYLKDNNIITKIEYYKDFTMDSTIDTTIDTTNIVSYLEKEIITHDSGYIMKQVINPNGEKYTNEELILQSYKSFRNIVTSNNIDQKLDQKFDQKLDQTISSDFIKQFAIPISNIQEGTLLLSLDNKGNMISISEYINGEFHDRISIIELSIKNKLDKPVYYLAHVHKSDNIVNDKQFCQIYEHELDSICPLLYYEGELLNKQLHGNGSIFFNGKIKYSGIFEKGQLISGMLFKLDNVGLSSSGSGSISESATSNNSYISYNGKFKDNIPHGEGIFFNKYGIKIYEGQIVEGKYNGEGVSYWDTTGSINWEGKWKNNQKHGKGKLYDDTGNLICNCTFENDQMLYID